MHTPTYNCIAMCILISEHEDSIREEILFESANRMAPRITSTASLGLKLQEVASIALSNTCETAKLHVEDIARLLHVE